MTVLDEDLRLLATAVTRGDQTYVVVVGSSLDERNEALMALLATGMAGLVVALLAAVAAGYATAGLALRPVRAALTRERRFIAEASHALRTPLAVITAEVELAALAPADAAAQAAALRSVGEEATRMTRLTDQLLLLAAHDERRLRGPREPVVVPTLLEAVAARHRGAARSQGRMITVTADPDVVVYVDRARLEGALDGLVENALRHGAGTVDLAAAAADRKVVLRVRDQGDGFSATAFETVPPRAGLDRYRPWPRHRRGGGRGSRRPGDRRPGQPGHRHPGLSALNPGSERGLTRA